MGGTVVTAGSDSQFVMTKVSNRGNRRR
jgi:hypothetical protein